jgi:type IV pilus assembly protein PilV
MLHTNQIAKNKKTIVKKMIVKPVAIASKMQGGIALLESLIAILIFSMGILAIVGLQGFMVKGVTETKLRSDASFLAQNRISMIWAAPNDVAGFAEEDTAVSGLPGGLRTTTITPIAGAGALIVNGGGAVVNPGTEVTVTIRWQQPGEVQHRYSVIARIAGAS